MRSSNNNADVIEEASNNDIDNLNNLKNNFD